MSKAASPPKPAKQSPIEGIDLVKPLELHADFRKFRHDDLFFISHCSYIPAGEKSIQRLVAVTPQAFFICDPNGKMDRATRIEALSSCLWQNKTEKKMFGTKEVIHFVVKIPSEYDVFFSIEKNVKGSTCKAEHLATVMELLCKVKCKDFKISEADAEKDVKAEVSTARPEGFLSPQEILQQNKQRQDLLDRMEGCTKEVLSMRGEVLILQKEVDEREVQLKTLEQATGSDLGDVRKKRDNLQHIHANIHRSHTGLDIEVMRLQTECKELAEALEKDRENFSSLVAEGVEASGSTESEKYHETFTLRKKQQVREMTVANQKLEIAKTSALVVPIYDCGEDMAVRANQSEKEVAAAFVALDREFSQADKMKKFFDKMNSDLEREGTAVAEKAVEKEHLLDAREKYLSTLREKANAKAAASTPPPVAVAAVAPAAADLLGGDDDDDDLLGGGGAPTPPRASAGVDDDLLGGDDDLLGGDDKLTAPAVAPVGGGDAGLLSDDDDLLGGGGDAPGTGGGADDDDLI